MRLTLLPSLLDVVARNLKHTEEGLGFFEMARTFFRRSQDLPYERRTLTLVLTGRRTLRSWESQAPGGYTFYDVKGMLSTVLDALQIKDWRVEATTHAALHPGRGATLHLQGRDVAYLGELHPQVAAAFEIEGWPVQVAEIDLDTLFEAASTVRVFHPLPRFPAARRDIAVIVDADLPAECVLDVVRQAGGEVLELADIFDVYAGDQLAANRKSIAISMELRAPGATLTQEEIAGVMERIVGRLHDELNATLRE
jgi:phenylalanyl-tRNA synthetase beta chain